MPASTDEHTEVVQYNALRMFDIETAQTEFGMQDVIYSIGFFDYLPDDFLVKLLNSLYRYSIPAENLLRPLKMLIVTVRSFPLAC